MSIILTKIRVSYKVITIFIIIRHALRDCNYKWLHSTLIWVIKYKQYFLRHSKTLLHSS